MRGPRQLRWRVLFEKAVDVDDGGGGVTRAWETRVKEPAQVERVRSLAREMERVQSGGLEAQPVVRLHVRAHGLTRQITTGDRAVNLDTNEVMDVQSIQEAEDSRRWLVVLAVITEVV